MPPTPLKRGPKDREQTNRVRNQSILHPGLGEDRFGQLRVKAAFGPGFDRRCAALTRSSQAETQCPVIPGM